MNLRYLIRVLLASGLLLTLMAQMASGATGVPANAVEDARFVGERGDGSAEGNEPPQQSGSLPQTAVIIVGDRTLTGPYSSAQQRGGRFFLPVTSIAQALGDVIQSDPVARTVTVRRQNGIVASFDAHLNQVRENGSVTLQISGTADIVFPPDAQELMLPAEIVAALLDVSIQREEGHPIRITRGPVPTDTVRAGALRAPWELYQVEYDYGFNHYTSSTDHNLSLHGTGRLRNGRFTFLTNFVSGTAHSRVPNLHSGNFTLEWPGGQNFVVGDFGTGNDLEFMSTTVRGGKTELPVGNVRLNIFAGRSISGSVNPVLMDASTVPGEAPLSQTQPRSAQFHFDTSVLGAYVTTGSYTNGSNGSDLHFSGGVVHFAGPARRGDIVTGGIRFTSRRTRFQADLGAGAFSGLSRENVRINGAGAALNLSGSLQLTDQLIVQGRYRYVARNFLSVQGGLLDPINLYAGGVTWQPKKWLTASLSGSTATRPGKTGDFNQFTSATLNLTPSRQWPTVFFSHTQSSTPQLKSAAFTLASAAKEFSHWRLFVNATRVKTFGPAALNGQAGASFRINESNTLEVSQSAGSRGLVSGTATWQLSNLLAKRFNISGGLGYMRSETSTLRTTEQVSASMRLRRESVLQLSYLHTQAGPTLLISLRGLLLSSRRAALAINGPVGEVNSYGAVYGRVYQDVNVNGHFDPDIDQPQANVKVRVDGNRYVVSGADGNFHIDNVPRGDHSVYLDLLSVRADLTLLDGAQQAVSLISARDSVVDFRLVHTGRISGLVWLDLNENGRPDEGEQPLADVRVVTASGRDTLTDANGNFMLGDLPPGEHLLLVDEKTLPDQTKSVRGSLSVKVLVGSETGDVLFPVTVLPPEVKRFPGK
ncbi:MAG: hypothetical protein ABI923_08505 [bacterium]